jgi:hypothetical protein
MKNRAAGGLIAVISGSLAAFGPQSLFKICDQGHHMMSGGHSVCYYTAQASIAIGVLIALLGIAYFIFADGSVRAGLSLAIAGSSTLLFAIANILIGMDEMETMACRVATLPALNVISIITFTLAAVNTVWLLRTRGVTVNAAA